MFQGLFILTTKINCDQTVQIPNADQSLLDVQDSLLACYAVVQFTNTLHSMDFLRNQYQLVY